MWLNLDKNRIDYLIKTCIGERVLLQFFKDNQKYLIVKKLKLDVIPKGMDRLMKLIREMPDTELGKLREFLLPYLEPESSADELLNGSILTSIAFFLLKEHGIIVESASDAERQQREKNHAKILLRDLLSDTPNPENLKLMQSKLISPSGESAFDVTDQLDLIAEATGRLLEDSSITDVRRLSDIDLFLALPLKQGNERSTLQRELQNRIGSTSISPTSAKGLLAYINNLQLRQSDSARSPISVKALEGRAEDNAFDFNDCFIIGEVRGIKEDSNTRFVEPIAYVANESFFRFSDRDKEELTTGKGQLRWPSGGARKILDRYEVGIFKVCLNPRAHESGYGKYDVDRLERKLTRVLRCPESLFDIGRLRTWLINNQVFIAEHKAIIVTEDDFLLRPLFSGDAILDFNSPWNVYAGNELLEIRSQLFCTELGASIQVIDVSDIKSFFRRNIKGLFSGVETQNSDVLASVIRSLEALDVKGFKYRKQEVLDHVYEIVSDLEIATAVVNELSVSKTVSDRVEERISELVRMRSEGLGDIQREIESLERKRKELAASISKLEVEAKEARGDISTAIRSAFKKGVLDGKKTLAESAVFSAIFDSSNRSLDSSSSAIADTMSRGAFRLFSGSEIDIPRELKVARCHGIGERLITAIRILSRCGCVFGMKGRTARILARALAASICSELVLELVVEPGTSRVENLSSNSLKAMGVDGIILSNFDVSVMSIYSPELVDTLIRKIWSQNDAPGPSIFACFEQSGLGIPLTADVSPFFCVIDADSIDFKDYPAGLDDFEQVVYEVSFTQDICQDIMTSVIKSLRKIEADLENEDLRKVLGFLQKSYVDFHQISS
jgi:hypothetical protein